MISIRGRCIQITASHLTIMSEGRISKHSFAPSAQSLSVKVGDLVKLEDQQLSILTKQTSQKSKLTERILHPRRLKTMRMRNLIEYATRDFFINREFTEVRTPLLVRSSGMEAHIDPFQLKSGVFLPSSPEFAMKKLLVGGLEKIFQICPAFRDEPISAHHRPEFTMLEFYRAYSNDLAIQEDVEQLVEFLAKKINDSAQIFYQGININVATPWPRLKVNELFKQHLDIDLNTENSLEKLRARAQKLGTHTDKSDSWDEIYFRLWIERVEPKLPNDRAAFVTHYPRSQAALANLEHTSQGTWAKRFEAYIGGLELCNGFDELTDAKEQRLRFEHEIELRKTIAAKSGASISPIDEEFLAALEEGLPPSGGVAVGLEDRKSVV